jgi:hypothetical protein
MALSRGSWLTDPFDDPPFKLVFRAIAVSAHLKEAGFGSQPSNLRGRQARWASTEQAWRHFGGGAWRHVDSWFEEKPERLEEPELFVKSDCGHGHSFDPRGQGRNRAGAFVR